MSYQNDSDWAWTEFVVGVVVGVLGFIVLICIIANNSEKVPPREDLINNFNNLQKKYDALSCSTRGLVVTEVKGITLCMDENTRALYKIDGE